MSLLKSYTCSRCAGVLVFDYDQEFFDCPFCGTKFNAVDFHDDEIMTQAEESLKKEAFSSAKEKYDLILENEPSDFEALKGLILCEIKAASLESLNTPGIFDTVDIVSLKNLITRLKKQASIKDSAFFDQLLNLIDLSDRLKIYQNSINSLYDEDTRAEINKSFKDIESRKYEDKQSPNLFAPLIFLGGFVFTGLACLTRNFEFAIIIFLFVIMAGSIILLIFKEDNTPAPIYDNPIHDAWEMKKYLEKQYRHYEKEYGTEYEKLTELDRASKAQKPDTPVPEEIRVEKNIINTDHAEPVICSKCAGQLYLDKERRVYECRSCGVAYGISLFFGMPMEKALNAMNTGHYGEAQKRFENILMVSPTSFDALLGRILCAGRWTRISDIDTSDIISGEDWLRITELFSDAKLRAAESDKEFLGKLEELIFLLGKICLNNGNIDELNRKVEVLDSISHVYFMAEKLSTDSGGVSMDRAKLLNDIENMEKETRQMSHEFLAIKRNLIQKKNDCILVK
jgi:uncharacterized Zn finger protein (UPF0148 family)